MRKQIALSGLLTGVVCALLAAPAGAIVNGTYTNPIDEYSDYRSLEFIVKNNQIVSGQWRWGWMCGNPEIGTYSYTGSYPIIVGNNPNPFPIPLAADGSFEATDSFGPYDDPMVLGYRDSQVTLRGRIVGGSASGTLHQVDHGEEPDPDCTSYGEEWTANVEDDDLGPAEPSDCSRAKAKVRTLKRKLKKADNAKYMAKLRAKLKKAKEKKKVACAEVS